MAADLGFISLADYKAPAVPTTKLVEKYWRKTLALISHGDQQPYLPSDELASTDDKALRQFFPPPRYDELYDELDATLKNAFDHRPPHPLFWLCLPAGDPGILAGWAARHDYQVLSPPTRADLSTHQSTHQSAKLGEQAKAGRGVLVVPMLERWFLRELSGVTLLKATLSRLEAHDGPVIISTNGFALLFLQQLFAGHNLMAKALTFRPYQGERLYRWLFQQIYQGDSRSFIIKDSVSGRELFAKTSAEPCPAPAILARLAADCRGIPWLAWQLLTSTLKTRKQVSDGDSTTEVYDTSAGLWRHAPAQRREHALYADNARFLLHALAVHGPLAKADIARVIPCDLGSLGDLCLDGFVLAKDGEYRLNPLCYSAIVQSLKSAGIACPAL